jgi:hypothetical protein
VVLSAVALLSSLLLLWAALDSNNPGSLFQRMGLPGMQVRRAADLDRGPPASPAPAAPRARAAEGAAAAPPLQSCRPPSAALRPLSPGPALNRPVPPAPLPFATARPQFDQVVTMIYLKVSLSDFLTLFSARTHDGFFWSSAPSWMLATGACISMGISTIIACFWPSNAAHFWTDGISVRGLALDAKYRLWPLWVWIYCVIWWWIQDACKVAFYWFMHKINLFQINTAKLVNVRAQTTFGGKDSLARMSAGMVEGKLLEMKVGRAARGALGPEGPSCVLRGGAAPPNEHQTSGFLCACH